MGTRVGPTERLRLYRRLFHELNQQRLDLDDNPAGMLLVQAEIRALEDIIMQFAELNAAVFSLESKQLGALHLCMLHVFRLAPGPGDMALPASEGLDMSLVGDLLLLSATSPWTVYVAERSQLQLFYVSPSCKRMMGWRPSELVGTSALDGCHKDDWASFRRMLVRENGQAVPGNYVSYRRRKKNNEYAQVQATGRPVGARWFAWLEHDSSSLEVETLPALASGAPPGLLHVPTRAGPGKVVQGLPYAQDGKPGGITFPYDGSAAEEISGEKSQKHKPGRDGPSSAKALSQDLAVEVGGPATTQGPDLSKGTEPRKPGMPPGVELLKGKKVLLVEDDIVNRKIAQRLLESVGCQVTVACNGKEALELLHKSPEETSCSGSDSDPLPAKFGLVLMDLLMPVMDGTHTVEAFREWEAEQEPPRKALLIFAVTSNVSDGDMVKCARSGFDEFVSKPLTVEKLLDRLLPRKQLESAPNRGL